MKMLSLVRKMPVYLFYYGFARYLPISYKPYSFGAKLARYMCGKFLFKKCGVGVNIEHGADFGSGNELEIGDYSGIGIHARIGHVKIGRFVMMAPEVNIITSSHKHDNCIIPMCNQGLEKTKPVTIGDDVWIGTRSVILPGVNIGKGSIVGANSVVTKDVEDYAIVAGNPAKVIRNRLRDSLRSSCNNTSQGELINEYTNQGI